MFDAPKVIELAVTQEDLAAGRPWSPGGCAIGIALKRATGAARVRVRGRDAITVYEHPQSDYGRVSYRGSREFQRFLARLDASPSERRTRHMKDPQPTVLRLVREPF